MVKKQSNLLKQTYVFLAPLRKFYSPRFPLYRNSLSIFLHSKHHRLYFFSSIVRTVHKVWAWLHVLRLQCRRHIATDISILFSLLASQMRTTLDLEVQRRQRMCVYAIDSLFGYSVDQSLAYLCDGWAEAEISFYLSFFEGCTVVV
jgi:hypothetical protein